MLVRHAAAASRVASSPVPRPRRVLPSRTQRRWLAQLPHRHLTGNGPAGLVRYDLAVQLQEEHRKPLFEWAALPWKKRGKQPLPICLSFVAEPVYTLGRRQKYPAESEATQLQARLTSRLHLKGFESRDVFFDPLIRSSLRGGLTTYHGPGQLVIWPVLHLAYLDRANISVARYVALVQVTTQEFLLKRFNIHATALPGEPGMWIDEHGSRARKIAALGMHFKRYVTGFGIAINLDVPVVGKADVNPWARIVPCGIEDKGVTSVAAEKGLDRLDADYEGLAAQWVSIFEETINQCPAPAGLWPKKGVWPKEGGVDAATV